VSSSGERRADNESESSSAKRRATGVSKTKKLTPDQKRAELDKIMRTELSSSFTPSSRVKYLYSGYGKKGDKVQVRFDKTNFKVIVGKPSVETLVRSIPLGDLKVSAVVAYLRDVMNVF
jgi:hypothetical protein